MVMDFMMILMQRRLLTCINPRAFSTARGSLCGNGYLEKEPPLIQVPPQLPLIAASLVALLLSILTNRLWGLRVRSKRIKVRRIVYARHSGTKTRSVTSQSPKAMIYGFWHFFSINSTVLRLSTYLWTASLRIRHFFER